MGDFRSQPSSTSAVSVPGLRNAADFMQQQTGVDPVWLRNAADRVEALEWRVIALEQVISEEMYPENCSDDANRMLLESAIESHGRRIKARSALSPSPTKGDGK